MRRRAAFTLIEMMAVVLIIALVAGFALPNLGLRASRVLDEQTRRIAADVEFARQRAVMTGARHRLLFDMEEMSWRVEWWVSEARAFGEEDEAALDPEEQLAALDGQAPLDLAPPREEERDWRPLPGPPGRWRVLDSLVLIDHVETPDGLFDRGEVQLVFEDDGTSDPTWVVVARDDGVANTLEILPLADTVRFERGTL